MAKKMARSAALTPTEAFIRNCTYLDAQQKQALYASESRYVSTPRCLDPASRHLAAFDKVRHADFLNQMLYLDTKIFMPTLNLTYNDKMSMASSVEVRVPFLDRQLAEFVAWNVKPEWKLKGKWRPVTKYIFREAMRSMLPEEVMRQPKAGFRGARGLLAGARFASAWSMIFFRNRRFDAAGCFVLKSCAATWTSTAAARKTGQCKSGNC